ncbi:MAG TPA: LysR family transcriptional regulator, partial [Parvularcula sp.]|nr:LysR family transcriptional regulator [Parvularcula sp.]
MGMSDLRDRLRWDDVEIFCQLAAHGSLRKAAQATGQSLETIRRRINALEVALGERLFRRTTQGLQITASGREILAKAR